MFYFEYMLVRSAYNSEPLLQALKDEDEDAADAAAHPGCVAGMFRKVVMVCKGWSAYKRQSVRHPCVRGRLMQCSPARRASLYRAPPGGLGCVGACSSVRTPAVLGTPRAHVLLTRGASARYFTVLSFGILMTAYLKWAGMPQSILGAARGVGAGFGVTATFVYPVYVPLYAPCRGYSTALTPRVHRLACDLSVCARVDSLHNRIGLKATGMVAIVLEFLCLLPCFIPAMYALGSYVTRGSLPWPTRARLTLLYTAAPAMQALCREGVVPWRNRVVPGHQGC